MKRELTRIQFATNKREESARGDPKPYGMNPSRARAKRVENPSKTRNTLHVRSRVYVTPRRATKRGTAMAGRYVNENKNVNVNENVNENENENCMRLINIPFILSMSGKVFGRVNDWWATTRYGKTYTAHKNKGRDYKEHPVTEEEKKTRERLKRASKAFNDWRPTDEELLAMEEAFQKQLKESKNPKKTLRGYYIHLQMEEMKQEGELKADPSQYLEDWANRISWSRSLIVRARNLRKVMSAHGHPTKITVN